MNEDLLQQIMDAILDQQGISLTEDQSRALGTFFSFLKSDDPRSIYLLTGSAGTGKTFMINLFSRLLKKYGFKVILLAPTGRAAKVITRRARRNAYTIHHHIYSVREDSWGGLSFQLRANKEESKTVYIVDEASMIGSDTEEGSGQSLLEDLLGYVFETDNLRKLVIVGDPIQLPPVGLSESPALSPSHLGKIFPPIHLYQANLEEVRRQTADSGILENSIQIKDAYLSATGEVPSLISTRDVVRLENSYEALETFLSYYEPDNLDKTVFITYSNYQSVKVNTVLRKQLFETEEALVSQDIVMVVKNNYAWGDEQKMPFIANGEMGVVQYVDYNSYEERYGLKWIDAEIAFQIEGGMPYQVTCKVILSLLDSKLPQLNNSQMNLLFQERREEYQFLTKAQARVEMRSDPYMNALQLKYGYAITGHKAQGGQWENVIVSFEPDYGNNLPAYLRWTYTVFTRAESRLYLLNNPFE